MPMEMKELPPDAVKVTVNTAGQIRVFPNAALMKQNGFRKRAKVTFMIREEKEGRFGYITQLLTNDPRNIGKHQGTYVIQQKGREKEFTINVGMFTNMDLVPISKGPVASWIMQPGALRIALPPRFRKRKGAFADTQDEKPDRKSINKKSKQEMKQVRVPTGKFDAFAIEDAVNYIDMFSNVEQLVIRKSFGWIKAKRAPAAKGQDDNEHG